MAYHASTRATSSAEPRITGTRWWIPVGTTSSSLCRPVVALPPAASMASGEKPPRAEVKVTPASSFAIADYGVQDRWVGHLEGTREYVRRAVERSLDWTELRVLDPSRGALARQVDVLRLLKDEFGEDVPFIQTIFSPLAQAKNIAGPGLLIEHMRTAPDRVKTGLNTITESTLPCCHMAKACRSSMRTSRPCG